MNSTISALNIMLSIEKLFRDLFPDIPIFRFGLPVTKAEQLNFVETRALFLNLTLGNIDRKQDTYCTLWLAERSITMQYLPFQNYRGLWLQEMGTKIQTLLNKGDENFLHLFPLYDYQASIPDTLYNTFLDDGDTTPLEVYLARTPQQIPNTGFFVRAGHNNPKFEMSKNPAFLELTCVFQHWSPDVYCEQRG